jgi:predicted DNA-binding protein
MQAVIGQKDIKMATQIVIRIDPEVKERFSKLARMGGKTPGQMARELIEDYIKGQDIGTYIDDLWSRIGITLKSKGKKQGDIRSVVKKIRKPLK